MEHDWFILPTAEEKQKILEDAYRRSDLRRSSGLPPLDIKKIVYDQLDVLHDRKFNLCRNLITERIAPRYTSWVKSRCDINGIEWLAYQDRYLRFIDYLVHRKLNQYYGSQMSLFDLKELFSQ